ARRLAGALAQLHRDRLGFPAAVPVRVKHLHRHGVARFLLADDRREVFRAGDFFAVDRLDDVPADGDRAALRTGRDAAFDAGLRRGRVGLDALDERAALGRQVQALQRAVDRDRRHAEVAGAADRAALLEFAELGLGRVDRHGEADADAAGA